MWFGPESHRQKSDKIERVLAFYMIFLTIRSKKEYAQFIINHRVSDLPLTLH